jgi:hypothetical protein
MLVMIACFQCWFGLVCACPAAKPGGVKKNRQAGGAGGFSGIARTRLARSLRRRLGKAAKVKVVGAIHDGHFRRHSSMFPGIVQAPPAGSGSRQRRVPIICAGHRSTGSENKSHGALSSLAHFGSFIA